MELFALKNEIRYQYANLYQKTACKNGHLTSLLFTTGVNGENKYSMLE